MFWLHPPSGTVAVQSLDDIGLLKQHWSELRHTLRRAPHKERATLPTDEAAAVFVTYHASARAVNQTVAARYADDVEWQLLKVSTQTASETSLRT